MAHLTKSLALLATLGMTGTALAQTATTETAPAATTTETAPATAPAATTPTTPVVPQAGMAGMDGMSGMSGMAGMAGTAAPTGMAGMDGMSGMSGMAGTAAPTGMAGMDGMSGMSGMAGTAAPTGMAGMDGMAGMSGMAGTAAPTGMAGMDGMSGMSGMAGTAAPTGMAGMDGMAGMSGMAPADGVGTTYTKETHGDWTLRCIKTGTDKDPCELYQLLKDKDGNSVAEISIIALPKGSQAVAGATLITPLETSLLEQVSIAVDSAKPQLYPFAFCTATGCVSRIGFTEGELAALKKGNKATVAVAPISAPKGQKVELALSLSGFTAGFDAVAKANEGMDLQ